MRTRLTLTLACTLLTACGPSRPEPVPASAAGAALALSVDVPFAELVVPPDSRDGVAPPDAIPLDGWTFYGSANVDAWTTPLPVRPRSLTFVTPPRTLDVQTSDGADVKFSLQAITGKTSWRYSATDITLRLPTASPAPAAGAFQLSYPKAAERERRLNFQWSGLLAADFVKSGVYVDFVSRSGLLLPAPARASWDVTLPPAAELHFSPGLVPPEVVDGPASDGATLVVEVEVAGGVTPVWTGSVSGPSFEAQVVDLSRWSGQAVRLRMRTEPGATSHRDYVHVADPVVVSRKRDPKRVVLVFVDTTRADHLTPYGYHRTTTPELGAWAERAAVFEQARTVAPWTLPSARTMLTGRYPEHWDRGPTLPGRLRQAGWATAMFAGNLYLSSTFQVDRDWGQHRAVQLPDAEDEIDQALAWWRAQEGRDALLLVHLMDPHLPYKEPAAYRRVFAGDADPRLGETFHRGDVLRAGKLDATGRKYLIDRYDNNLRYVDTEVGRLLRAVGDDALVVFLSDHGEEFWDHNAFEHGHAMFDEVIRIPLMIAGPGIPGGRHTTPVSMLDITPTILAWAGLPAEKGPSGVIGDSLLELVHRKPGAADAFAHPIGIGHPLYGSERWGVYEAGKKYTAFEGREALYDLTTDAHEKSNLLRDADGQAGAAYRARYEVATGQPLEVCYRLVNTAPRRGSPRGDMEVLLTVPGGIARAWIGEDPTGKSKATLAIDGEHALITWKSGYSGSREVYFVPTAPFAEVTLGVSLTVKVGAEKKTFAVAQTREPELGTLRNAFVRERFADGRGLMLTWGIAAPPTEGGTEVSGHDPEVAAALQAMGYAVGDGEDGPDDDDDVQERYDEP